LFCLSFRGGSGLGLYIAAGIVKLHEGCSLTAASPGEELGSTFFLQCPVAAAPPVADQSLAVLAQQTPAITPPVSGLAGRVENLNILIAVRTLARSLKPFLTPHRFIARLVLRSLCS
jgi:hypothetical protein